jgi:hypothetical protein
VGAAKSNQQRPVRSLPPSKPRTGPALPRRSVCGTLTLCVVNAVATFSDLAIDRAGAARRRPSRALALAQVRNRATNTWLVPAEASINDKERMMPPATKASQ